MSRTLELLIQCAQNFNDVMTIADYQNEDRPLIFVNEHFTDITGYTSKEVIGRNCRFLQGNATDTNVIKELRESIRNGISCFYDIVNYKKDGKPFWNRLILIPIFDDVMGLRYYIGIQSDITKKKENEKSESITEYSSNHSSGEIGHKIENPLMEILAKYRSLPYFTDGSKESQTEVKNIVSEINSETAKIIQYVRSL